MKPGDYLRARREQIEAGTAASAEPARLLTRAQVCTMLHVTRPTLRHLNIPTVRITDTTTRYDRADVEAWITNHKR